MRRNKGDSRMLDCCYSLSSMVTGDGVLRKLDIGDDVHFFWYANERFVNLHPSVNPWDVHFRVSEPVKRLTPLQHAGILYSEGRDEVRQGKAEA